MAVVECNAQITLDGTLGTQQALAGPNFTIDSTLGQIRGSNLFHSFGRFNVQTGQTATFTNSLPNPIANVLSRVTGGERSLIDGTLRSTIAGANLYLLNPSGVMFGPNATLDISGSFHVSTADYLRLADGGTFHVNPMAASVLTIAPPVAFGFLGTSPATITFDRTLLEVPEGKTLSAIGGDIQMMGATLRAGNGRLQLASVASPGEAVPNAPGEPPDLQVGSFARLGKISILDEANATVSSNAGAGTVLIRGGRLLVDNLGEINANTNGLGDGAPLGIDIRLTDDAVFSNGSVMVHASFAAGKAGEARITAGKLRVDNESFISGGAFSTGGAGSLTINVGNLELLSGGSVIAQTQGPANGANLDVTANSLSISGINAFSGTGLSVGQFSGAGTGNGPSLTVKAGSINVVGSNNPNLGSGILGSTSGPGMGGPIRVTSQSLTMGANTSISNATFGRGPAGSVAVNVEGDISITGSTTPNVFTGIFANTFGTGKGGTVQVTSGSLHLAQFGSVQAQSIGRGDAGSVTVHSSNVEIASGSFIITGSIFGSGNAGDLTVKADNVLIKGIREAMFPLSGQFTGLSTTTGVNGKLGGNLTVTASSILLTDKGAIDSQSRGAGNAGTIQVTTDSLQVIGRAAIISSARGSGRGGNIDIKANDVTVSGAGAQLGPDDTAFSAIGSQAAGGSGSAGDVNIAARTLSLLDGGHIETNTFSAGKAGNISIQADKVLVSGINAELEAFLRTSPSGLTNAASSSIASGSAQALTGQIATGSGGTIKISAGDLRVDAGARLETRTRTTGDGGNIEVMADRVTLSGNSLVTAESRDFRPAGKAGNISLSARDTMLIIGSKVSTVADFAAGGNITINGNRVQLAEAATVTAQSLGPGNAGNITITAGDTLSSRNSVVTTESVQADGGNITLKAPTMVHLVDTKVTTAVGTGQGSGGNITIDPLFVLLDGTEIRADAFGGPGGNISITADVFLTQDSILSASSALSTPGAIDIQARVTDIAGKVARLPEATPPAAALLRASCAARLAGGSISSLVVAGREGLPPDPEGLLPSPLIIDGVFSAAAPAKLSEPIRDRLPRFLLASADQLCSGFRVR